MTASLRPTGTKIIFADEMLAALKVAHDFIESEVENRGAAGSEMSDYQDEAAQALEVVATAIAHAEGRDYPFPLQGRDAEVAQ